MLLLLSDELLLLLLLLLLLQHLPLSGHPHLTLTIPHIAHDRLGVRL